MLGDFKIKFIKFRYIVKENYAVIRTTKKKVQMKISQGIKNLGKFQYDGAKILKCNNFIYISISQHFISLVKKDKVKFIN